MAMRALTTADTADFVSVRDPDAKVVEKPVDPLNPALGKQKVVEGHNENASVFKVRALGVHLLSHIYDNAQQIVGRQGSDDVGIKTNLNKTNIDAVRFGLVVIPDNFRTEQGEQIRFKAIKENVNGREYQAVPEHVLDNLGLELIGEMATFIKGLSQLKDADKGNSDGASLQSD